MIYNVESINDDYFFSWNGYSKPFDFDYKFERDNSSLNEINVTIDNNDDVDEEKKINKYLW